MDWFENRVPSKWLLNVEKIFPNSSSSVFFVSVLNLFDLRVVYYIYYSILYILT